MRLEPGHESSEPGGRTQMTGSRFEMVNVLSMSMPSVAMRTWLRAYRSPHGSGCRLNFPCPRKYSLKRGPGVLSPARGSCGCTPRPSEGDAEPTPPMGVITATVLSSDRSRSRRPSRVTGPRIGRGRSGRETGPEPSRLAAGHRLARQPWPRACRIDGPGSPVLDLVASTERPRRAGPTRRLATGSQRGGRRWRAEDRPTEPPAVLAHRSRRATSSGPPPGSGSPRGRTNRAVADRFQSPGVPAPPRPGGQPGRYDARYPPSKTTESIGPAFPSSRGSGNLALRPNA